MHPDPIGILCAMAEEIEHLRPLLTETDTHRVADLAVLSGLLDDVPVVLAESGIGKVNAAFVSTMLLQQFGCGALVLAGVAGGVDPATKVGDIVIGEAAVQHDYGSLIAGRVKTYPAGVPPLPGFEGDPLLRVDPALLVGLRARLSEYTPDALAKALGGGKPTVHYGSILAGDHFLNCAETRERLYAEFGAIAVEMESGPVAQIAARFGAPWLVVRAISDLAGDDSHLDFATFLPEAARLTAPIVREMVALLAERA